nr:MAG TPA: hypothetical protein [Caudoviricetes sp.]
MCVISFDICIKPTPVLKIELLRNGHSKSSTRKTTAYILNQNRRFVKWTIKS